MNFATLLRRWWIGLLAVCLLAVGTYVFLTKADGVGLARDPKQGPNPATRGVPVVAAAAKRGDIGVYLTGLGSGAPCKYFSAGRSHGWIWNATVCCGSRIQSKDSSWIHRRLWYVSMKGSPRRIRGRSTMPT